MALTIVAHITAEAGKEDLVRNELKKLVGPTLQEAGCLQYDLHENNDQPGSFMFYENWTERELWQDHMNAPHLAAYSQAVEGAIASFELFEMTKV